MRNILLKQFAVLVPIFSFVFFIGCAYKQPLDRTADNFSPAGMEDPPLPSSHARESKTTGAAVYHAAQLLTGEAHRKHKPKVISGQCFVQSQGNILTACPRMHLHLLSEDGKKIRKVLVKNGSFMVDVRSLKTFQLIPVSEHYKVLSGREIGNENLTDERGLKIRLIGIDPKAEIVSPK
jgi:hypothetical protein